MSLDGGNTTDGPGHSYVGTMDANLVDDIVSNLVDDPNLMGGVDDDDDDEEIPDKDSDDEAAAHQKNKMTVASNSSYRPIGTKVDSFEAQLAADRDTVNMDRFGANVNPKDISYAFGDEEEKNNAMEFIDSGNHEQRTLDKKELFKYQETIDNAVQFLLRKENRGEGKDSRRSTVRRQMPDKLGVWTNQQLDEEIVNVAEAMAHIESVAMYNQDWYRDDEKNHGDYELRAVKSWASLSLVPDAVCAALGVKREKKELKAEDGGDDTGAFDTFIRRTTTAEFGGNVRSLKAMAGKVGKVGKVPLGGQDKQQVICNACGIRLKFGKRRRSKGKDPLSGYNFKGFACGRTQKEWIFHDNLCVKLRKIKEAIRRFVYEKEKEEDVNAQDENILINIETNASIRYASSFKPHHKTTAKNDRDADKEKDKGGGADGSGRAGGGLEQSASSKGRHSMQYSVEYSSTMSTDFLDSEAGTDDEEDMYLASAAAAKNTSQTERKEQIEAKDKYQKKKNYSKLGYIADDGVEIPKNIHLRRYRCNVRNIQHRMDSVHLEQYRERFQQLPKVLLHCDLNEFGVSIFEFVSDSLKSKMRRPLWTILEWLSLEMPTNDILHLLKRNTHLLTKHELDEYDRVCKACMEGSKYPIACALRLSAFMFERAEIDLSNRGAFREKGNQYVNVARKLISSTEIESDHLFALLLMIPTDISHNSVIEIALKYDLTHFLEDPRIVRVFSVIWFEGYDFLDPSHSFNEPDISVDTVFDKLVQQPGQFFFSPFGKFVVSSVLYLLYLGLFSYVTYLRLYDYSNLSNNPIEAGLWVSSVGYVVSEVLEFVDSPKEYFSSMANYFDVLITINWLVLCYLRFSETDLQYGDNGTLDEVAQRNQRTTEIYMAIWSLQCVILWTRVASLFKISQRAGPLLRMIMNMLGDVANFFLIWILFFIGGAFAAYYIIGDDLALIDGVELGTLSSCAFYIFQTLLGQQDWDKSRSIVEVDENGEDYEIFDETRSNLLQALLCWYAIFGSVLLLNLLIAMMAASYEAVKDQALQELNKQKVDTIFDLDKSRAIIPPPLNVVAYFVFAYWAAFEAVTWMLTFGHRQFNEAYFSPINHENSHYQVGDSITFRLNNHNVTGKCTAKKSKVERQSGTQHDLQVEYQNDVKFVLDTDLVKVRKPFFKRRNSRLPSLGPENSYCRYCRFNITHDKMTIEYYLQLFDVGGQHIDPADKKYIRDMLSPVNAHSGVPEPITCRLCPNCYRPFKVTAKGPDVIGRALFILEIVSYVVFKYTLRWLFILLIFIPAFIVKLAKFILRKFTETVTGKSSDRATKSIMKASEENDDYRNKVRGVSKQEERMDAVVRRIDTSVSTLKKTLLGDDEDQDMDVDAEPLRSDEFDREVKKMKQDILQKFNEINRLLSSQGWED
eukprot:CAMPEP_0202689798 /NCGR_PEP_ID=MMETSP1385-20130828/4982_1 /ASSEMBLY_ACC=CAM_ASM_000861 /TAXON_ID=933848 /ORGANISM="Elphidium margaritaceum" /LENGTH=1408 /DNA_ID=CAMNT_0049344987 /DNA_START=72 /DNA_END=4298 /DNA_ORIENTATION=+